MNITGRNPPPLPPGAQPFTGFARSLHEHGFPLATEQTVAFLRALPLLGPRSIRDVYWAARATLAPEPDRLAAFDALFRAAFHGETGLPAADDCDEAPLTESGDGALEPLAAERANESGEAANAAEALAARSFAAASPSERLRALRRRIGALAPKRRGYRRRHAQRGDRLDLRRHLAALVRHEARALAPAWTRRVERHRRVLLLVDISGSMKAHSEDYLRFAHALTQALPRVETFTFGTRLTRLTRSLRHKDAGRALAECAPTVADWQGGTRIGENFARFLAVPRYSRLSRGAMVLVLSDGLERGDPDLMIAATRRLAARAWRLAWLTPLAADPAFRPETAALKAILPALDALADGSGIAPLCAFMESSAGIRRTA